jgi:hypothetical protein
MHRRKEGNVVRDAKETNRLKMACRFQASGSGKSLVYHGVLASNFQE